MKAGSPARSFLQGHIPGSFALILVLVVTMIPGCAYFSSLFDDAPQSTAGGLVPPRASNALSGSQFVRKIAKLSLEAREQAILKEALSGNIPDFMRRLKPVDIGGTAGGRFVKATIYVMPDYLAIGSDADHVRVPMNPITAQKIADQFGFLLPTSRIVDAIYKAAPVKLDPKPLPPGPQMTGVDYLARHNQTVRSQVGSKLGSLTAGHKKDVVLTNRLVNQPTKVAIYGWHRRSGRPIQPLSLVHGIRYVDYSHGIRLISQTMMVDGKQMSTGTVLRDKKLALLLSSEGALTQTRIQDRILSAFSELDTTHESF